MKEWSVWKENSQETVSNLWTVKETTQYTWNSWYWWDYWILHPCQVINNRKLDRLIFSILHQCSSIFLFSITTSGSIPVKKNKQTNKKKRYKQKAVRVNTLDKPRVKKQKYKHLFLENIFTLFFNKISHFTNHVRYKGNSEVFFFFLFLTLLILCSCFWKE